VNPSGQLALEFDGKTIAGAQVVGRRFETSSATISSSLSAALDEVAPVLTICLGLAPGRPALSLERVALNVRDFPLPDNDGVVYTDTPIIDNGPDARFSRLPIRAILHRWRENDIPGHISNTAGTYLCNQLFYLACAEGAARGIDAGFVHIPDTPQSAAATWTGPAPTMELSTMHRALTLAIETCLDGQREAPTSVVTGAVA
jgi:pyroglutamyl-peptidase